MHSSTYKNGTSRHTSTPPELSCCQHCQQEKYRTSMDDASTTTIINDYLSSLHYINSCHTLINQIIKCRQAAPNISMPQMPNFLNVLTYIAKDVRSLSDLKNLEALESLMRDVNITEMSANMSSVGKSSQASCHMSDKEVDAFRLPCDDAETSMKRAAKPDVRSTGIPRPIRGNDKPAHPKERPTSSTLPPSPPSHGYGDYNRFCRHRSPNNHQQVATIALASLNEKKQCRPKDTKLPFLPLDTRQSNIDTTDTSTDETDEYAKKLLLATDDILGPVTQDRQKKVRRVRSKTKRDCAMIQGVLKQWGIEVQSADNESVNDMVLTRDRSLLYLKYGDADGEKNSIQSPNAIQVALTSDSSEIVETRMVRKQVKSRNSRVSSKCSNGSHERMDAFNNIAATTEGLENTFITNEKPVWQQMATKMAATDDSDIEPDSDQKSNKSKHMNIMRVSPRAAKTVTFQTNPGAAYVVTQKPKDSFLMPRRHHSHSDVGSEHSMLQSSDIDDEVFDKKRRTRASIKVRQPVLPQKVLSNIGILTRTGQVKPEKERQLQELRSQLSTDMKTTLFRKPRDRKQETDDIVHLPTELATGIRK